MIYTNETDFTEVSWKLVRIKDVITFLSRNHASRTPHKYTTVTPNYVFGTSHIHDFKTKKHDYCPACRTTLVATRFRVAVICPIIQVPHCIRVFFYFVLFVFINHIFQFYYELCTYCNILDIYLS